MESWVIHEVRLYQIFSKFFRCLRKTSFKYISRRKQFFDVEYFIVIDNRNV